MAEYLIQEETLTNLGDKIRVLSGTEDTMTPSVMTTNVDEANSEINSQAELLAQAVAALEGKSAGGDSGGGASVETCTVTVKNESCTFFSFAYSNEEGAIYQTTDIPSGAAQTATVTMLKSSVLAVCATCFVPSVVCSGEVSYLGNGESDSHVKMFVFNVTGDGAITIRDDD